MQVRLAAGGLPSRHLHCEFVLVEAAAGKVDVIHHEVDRSAGAEIAVELQEKPKRTIAARHPKGQIVLNQARPSQKLVVDAIPTHLRRYVVSKSVKLKRGVPRRLLRREPHGFRGPALRMGKIEEWAQDDALLCPFFKLERRIGRG